MPAAIVTSRQTGAVGPFKIELILCATPDTSDTVQTRLQNAAYSWAAYSGISQSILSPTCAVVSSTKTITFGTLDGNTDVVVFVVGA